MISGIMIDLDGTIYKGTHLIDGAKEFVSFLNENGIPFVFLTNNSSFGRIHYLNKLRGFGLDVRPENILTSSIAAARYISEERRGKSVYPMGTEQFVREMKEYGLDLVDDDPDIVLLAFDKTITYKKINDAYHFLKNGAELIATHPDDLCPSEDGYDIDIGSFVRMLEQMTGTKANVIGKPSARMAEMAAIEMNADIKGMVMVGDRLYTDIKMAEDSGIRSVLVLSGETSAADAEHSETKPTYIAEHAGRIPELLQMM